MERILVPVDFSDCSRPSLVFARALAEPEEAEIHLLHVYGVASGERVTVRKGGAVTLSELAYQNAKRAMDEFVAQTGCEDATTHLLPGSPGRRILEFAEQGNFDLIVVGTHGRSGLQRLIMGSVAEYVVRQAPCPVLSIHARDAVEPPND